MTEAARAYFYARVRLNDCLQELWSYGIRTYVQEGDGRGWLVLYEMDANADKLAKMAEVALEYGAEFWQNPVTTVNPSASQGAGD